MFERDDRLRPGVHALAPIVDALRAETLTELPDARLADDFADLQRSIEQLEVERLRRLTEIDRRRIFEHDGHLSAASWLAVRHRIGWGNARYQVRIGRSLDDMPRTQAALRSGEVSLSAARLLASAHGVDADAFARSEAALVDAARGHTIQDLSRVVTFWRERAEHARAPERESSLRARRRVHASVSFLGMVRVDGELDPETGETLLTALAAVQSAEARSRGRDDLRSPAQRRADALGEVCRQWLDRADRPSVAGERPHVTVTVPVELLRGEHDANDGTVPEDADVADGRRRPSRAFLSAGEMDHVGPVPREVARRIACDASIRRVVMAGASEPLDVGRRTSVISPALRRALIARDRHCRFPGCDRPATWCDGHHVDHWADGGETCLTNLVLLCRRHHRLVHPPGGFGVRIVDGQPLFSRPDGSVLSSAGADASRAPP